MVGSVGMRARSRFLLIAFAEVALMAHEFSSVLSMVMFTYFKKFEALNYFFEIECRLIIHVDIKLTLIIMELLEILKLTLANRSRLCAILINIRLNKTVF